MSLNVYDDVFCTEELQRGDKVEMVVAIYESLDAVRSHEPDTETLEDTGTKRILQTQHSERDQLQAERGRLQRTLSELERDINKPGWIYFSSSIYYISTEKTSWYGSRQDCRKRGADLVTIHSKEEQDFIEKLRRGQTAWIGLREREAKGIWNWVDGSRLTTTFWGRGEPTGHGECVMIGHWSDPVNNWADYACNYSFVWICEKRIFS
ncbi:hypothetical protein AOLI_G00195350 [Acnodon oligacanthus]